MFNWLKTRKQLIFNAVMAALLVFSIGLNISDKSSTTGSVRWGVGEKVITLGYVDDVLAAGTVDYTYNGTNDNIPWQNALNALPATGGRLVDVSAVTKHFSATVSRAIPNVVIEGAGFGSNFTNNNSATLFTSGVNWIFTNLSTDNGGITIVATTQLDKVMVGSVKYNNRTDGLSLLASINASTLNATQVTATTGNFTTAYIVSGNITSANMSSLNMSGDILPTSNNTRSLGTTLVRWLTGWFINLVSETHNTTQLNATTANITTLNAPTGRGATYVIAAVNSTPQEKAQADATVNGTNDASVIQSALTAYKNVLLSSGNFNLTSNLTVANGSSLSGQSENATVIRFPTGGNGTSVLVVGAGVSVTEGSNSISKMTIDAAGAGYGIYVISGLHDSFTSLDVRNALNHNIYISRDGGSSRPDYIYMDDVWSHLATHSGLVIAGGNGGSFSGWFSDNGQEGFEDAGIVVTGNVTEEQFPYVLCWQNKSYNILVDWGYELNFMGGELNTSWLDSLRLKQGRGLNFSNFSFVTASYKGAGLGSFVAIGDTGKSYTDATFSNLFMKESDNNTNYYFSANGSGGTGCLTNIRFNGNSGKGWNLSGASYKMTNIVGTGTQSETSIQFVIPAGSTSASASHLMGHAPYNVYITQASSAGNYSGGFWPSWNSATVTANIAVPSSVNITVMVRAVSCQQ